MTTASIDQEELIHFLYLCPVGIAQIDPRGDISLINAMGSQLLMPHAPRSRLDNLFEILDAHDAAIRSFSAAQQEYGTLCEHRIVRLESEAAPLAGVQHVAFTLLKIGPETIMAVFEDVTRIVAAEAEARDLLTSTAIERGRSELAAEVLHDIGNAVVGIGTRSATLLEDSRWPELIQLKNLCTFLSARTDNLAASLGEKKAEALVQLVAEIHASFEGRWQRTLESMQSFTAEVHHIQEILNLHRHYARQSTQAGRERISLRVIAEDALTIQAAALEKRSIEIERRVAAGLPKLSLDRTRMIQVLCNLLRNACEAFDACPLGAGRTIRVEIMPNPGGTGVRLQLSDNACGFAPEGAESMFEKDKSTKGRGSGLGLYHCRKVAQAHGGTLVLTSDGPGLGASAILTLPASVNSEPDCA